MYTFRQLYLSPLGSLGENIFGRLRALPPGLAAWMNKSTSAIPVFPSRTYEAVSTSSMSIPCRDTDVAPLGSWQPSVPSIDLKISSENEFAASRPAAGTWG